MWVYWSLVTYTNIFISYELGDIVVTVFNKFILHLKLYE